MSWLLGFVMDWLNSLLGFARIDKLISGFARDWWADYWDLWWTDSINYWDLQDWWIAYWDLRETDKLTTGICDGLMNWLLGFVMDWRVDYWDARDWWVDYWDLWWADWTDYCDSRVLVILVSLHIPQWPHEYNDFMSYHALSCTFPMPCSDSGHATSQRQCQMSVHWPMSTFPCQQWLMSLTQLPNVSISNDLISSQE